MKASDFDERFNAGEDITDHLDLGAARRPLRDTTLIEFELPSWMVDSLDREAHRLGVTRQSVIKMWIAERLERNPS